MFCELRRIQLFAFSAMLMVVLTASAFGQGGEIPVGVQVDPKAAKDCIERCKNFLYSKIEGDHFDSQAYQGGLTALCTLALLSAGESPDDPRIQPLLRFLETNPSKDGRGTYVVSLRIMVMCLADPFKKRFGRIIADDVEFLVKTQHNDGGWSYPGPITDPSNTQFALLALHEAAQLGIEIEPETWTKADKYWNAYRARGGFSYSKMGGTTGSMTCAGISSLVIINENLKDPMDFIVDGQIACCTKTEKDPRIKGAIKWMSDNFSVVTNPAGGAQNKYYYLYGLERAGRVAGLRFFGQHDWYREGTAHLLVEQDRFLGGPNLGRMPGAGEVLNSSFALLFLAKGLRPILFGKYQYTDSDDWDVHPAGIHNLTLNVEKVWGFPMNWQTISGSANVNDLLEAPIIFMSGRKAFALNDDRKKALRSYIENGGFIFAEACQGDGCDDASGFDLSFRALMKDLFPNSELQPLPMDHAIWTAQFFVDQTENPNRRVLGLENCCRTSVVYCPANLSCLWQLDRPTYVQKFPKKVQKDIEWCRKLGINVAAYATNRDLKVKLEMPKVDEKVKSILVEQALSFPKLSHNGGADEAPSAWANAVRNFRSKTGWDVDLEKKMVPIRLKDMSDWPVLFMHGRRRVAFDDQEREDIKKYVETGNLLIIDAICANKEFAESARKEIDEMFPGQLKSIDANDEIWTEKFGADPVMSVSIRTPDPKVEGGARIENGSPKMLGIQKDGRWVLVFSPLDLSCALEHAAANQCQGYSNEDALKIVASILHYALEK